MIILEFDKRIWRYRKPGFYKSQVHGRKYRRVWWLFLAVTYYSGSQKDFCKI